MRVLSISLPPGIIVCAYSWRRRSSDQIKQSKNNLSTCLFMFFSASHRKNSIVGKLFKASNHFFPHIMIFGRLHLAWGYLALEKSFVLARWELLKVFRSKSNGHFRENTFLRKSYFFSSSDLARLPTVKFVFVCVCIFVFSYSLSFCVYFVYLYSYFRRICVFSSSPAAHCSPAGVYRQSLPQRADS